VITWPGVAAIAIFPTALAVIMWVATAHNRARWRRGVRAVERAAARDAIGREYEAELADLRARNGALHREIHENRAELADTLRERDAARATVTRVEALLLDLTRRGQYVSARRVAAALQGAPSLADAVLPELDDTTPEVSR